MRDWWTLHEALNWMVDHVRTDSELIGPLTEREAWSQLRAAAADGKIPLRSSWGIVPVELIESLQYQTGSDGSLWLVRRFLNILEMQSLVVDRRENPPEGWPKVTVSRLYLQKEFGSRHRSLAGRKPDFDWPWIEQAAFEHFAEMGGDKFEGRGLKAEIERHMMALAEKRHGRSPAQSLARLHADEVLAKLRTRTA